MTDARPHQPFADRLLEQETRVSESQLEDYRCKLQRRLLKAARAERRMRAATFGAAAVVLIGLFYFLIAAFLSPLGVYPLQHLFKLFPDPLGAIVGVVLSACYLTCAICVIPFLLLYFLQYRRKFDQTQQEQVLGILGELQRQIAELQKQEPPTES
jgi:hypothetical protein